MASRQGVKVGAEQSEELSIALALGSVTDAITVEADASGSVAAQLAPMDALLDEHSARTEIKPLFIKNFTAPTADFGELVEMFRRVAIQPNDAGVARKDVIVRKLVYILQ